MKAKIVDIKPAQVFTRYAHGTNFKKGDYLTGSKLYEVKTTKGTFNLDRSEIKSIASSLGLSFGVNITLAFLKGLIGAYIDTKLISDK